MFTARVSISSEYTVISAARNLKKVFCYSKHAQKEDENSLNRNEFWNEYEMEITIKDLTIVKKFPDQFFDIAFVELMNEAKII